MAETFFFFFKYFLVRIDCGDASNRSVFALIRKLMQDNQNKIKQQENKGYDLGVSTRPCLELTPSRKTTKSQHLR